MAVAKSLDESEIVWREFNANYANGTNSAKIKKNSRLSLFSRHIVLAGYSR